MNTLEVAAPPIAKKSYRYYLFGLVVILVAIWVTWLDFNLKLPNQQTLNKFDYDLKKVALLAQLTPDQSLTLKSLAADYNNPNFKLLAIQVDNLAMEIHNSSLKNHNRLVDSDKNEFEAWRRAARELNQF